jgi:hypothetical protein
MPLSMFNDAHLPEMKSKVHWTQKLAAALIVSAIKDEDWDWLRSDACVRLCDFIDLGFSAQELVARVEKIWPINFSQAPDAVLKQLREADA